MKKIQHYINCCKKLVNMPYNQLNLDNYNDVITKILDIPLISIETSSKSPIRLMSGQHKESKIVCTKNITSKKPRIILIGKGILFDAGGYDLKSKMNDMKNDMAGMASVLSINGFLQNTSINNVQSVCPVATNFIHNNQIIPGDIIKIGKYNVEITDTDAEGRLVLAEVLSSFKFRPNDIIVTVATLTGVVGYAIGDKATGIFSPNDELIKLYLEASKKTKELAWRLPLWDYLQDKFKGQNIKNWEKTRPGATMGAMFIKQFVPNPNNWIHLDIAYSAWNEEKNLATGEPIKTLIEFIKKLNKRKK